MLAVCNGTTRPSVKKRLLRPIEVETEYGLPVGELAKKRVAGGGDAPPFLRFGRSISYDREDLERWITVASAIPLPIPELTRPRPSEEVRRRG